MLIQSSRLSVLLLSLIESVYVLAKCYKLKETCPLVNPNSFIIKPIIGWVIGSLSLNIFAAGITERNHKYRKKELEDN